MENALCKRQDGEGHPQQVQCLHRTHNHGHDNGDHHHDEGLVKCIGKRRDWRGGMVKAPWVQYLPTCRDNRDLSLHQHHHCYHHRRYHQQQQTVVIPAVFYFQLHCAMTVVMFGVIKSGIRRTDKESVLTCSGVNFKISLVS